jgi:ABC-2 type transport system permease protein
MTNFWTQGYLSFKGLFPWLHWWSYLSSVWIRPFMIAAMFAVVGRFAIGSDAAERYLLGIAVAQMVYLSAAGILRTFGDDLTQGTLSHVLSASVNRFRLYWARGLPHSVNGLLAFVGCIISVWLILGFDLSRVNWPAFTVATLLISFSTTALVLGGSSLVIATREHSILHQTVIGALMLLTGVVIPVSELPDGLQQLSYVLPMTNGLFGLRDAFVGASLQDIAPDLGAEAAIGGLFAASGFLIFRYVERRGREQGFLEGGY